MTTWHLTIAIPIGLIWTVVRIYLGVGLLLIIPLDFWLYRLWQQRGAFQGKTYGEAVRTYNRPVHRFLMGIIQWPVLVYVVPHAAIKVAEMTSGNPKETP